MFKQCPLCKGNHFERVGLFGDQFMLCRLCSGKDHVNVVMGEKKPDTEHRPLDNKSFGSRT